MGTARTAFNIDPTSRRTAMRSGSKGIGSRDEGSARKICSMRESGQRSLSAKNVGSVIGMPASRAVNERVR